MKKSFTLIEILVVIVVLGILATITSQIIIKVYENYYYTKEYNKLSFETDLVLNEIASKLTLRVKNSLIACECNASKDATEYACKDANISSFNALSAIPASEVDKFKVLEWLGRDIYAKRGMWDDNFKRVVPGYSGFVDLKDTNKSANDEYNITTPYSNFNFVKQIDGNWSKQWGLDINVFDLNHTVLIFSGPDDRGDFLDVNHSYGYYRNIFPANTATRVFRINESNSVFETSDKKTILNIKAIDKSNSTTVYEKYYLINSAYAIVPVCNNDKCTDYNLTLKFNYFPWNKEDYNDGNETLLASHVTQFKFRDENGVVRIYICISSPKVIIKGEPLTVCKEKVVF
jgi:prepilin-type N-terminal cleavage/methylation domain-containing protein